MVTEMRSSYFHKHPPFATLAAILRASTSLAFRAYREWAIKCLEAMWPADLVSFSEGPQENAVEALVLAKFYDVPSLRKRAFYELLRKRCPYELLKGAGEDSYADGAIPWSYRRAMVYGRERVRERWATHAIDTSFNKSSGCKSHCLTLGGASKKKCSSTRMETVAYAYAKLVHSSGIFQKYLLDPLSGLNALKRAPWKEEGFCDECIKKSRRAWEAERVRVWVDLDEWFWLGKVENALGTSEASSSDQSSESE